MKLIYELYLKFIFRAKSSNQNLMKGNTCTFYNTPKGCRNGEKCEYEHVKSKKNTERKTKAALIFICSIENGKELTKFFKPNREAIELVILPLKKDFKDFIINSLKILIQQESLIKNSIFNQFSYGIGFNVSTKMFLQENWNEIIKESDVEKDCLLSIIQNPSLKHGYPNIDIVGCLGFGSVEKNEDLEEAAIREAQEESQLKRIFLEESSDLKIKNNKIETKFITFTKELGFTPTDVYFFIKKLKSFEKGQIEEIVNKYSTN